MFSSQLLVLSICDSSLPDRHAEDRIFVLPSWKKHKNDELIGTFVFTNPDNDLSPLIYELAILAQIWPLVSFYKKLLQLCWHNSGCTLRSI
jgi:hypothetical protein